MSSAARASALIALALALAGCGGARVEAASSPSPPSVDQVNDNVPALAVASSSVLVRDGAFFLRLDVAALRASPIAGALRDGQRRGGLFRDATGTTFDPVEGLDAVASMAPHARLTRRGIVSNEWTVVALVRRAGTPREIVEATVLRGEPSRWQERAGYAFAPFDPMWRGHAAFVGASREIVVMPAAREASMVPALLEQLARPESPIDPALVFDPGKLGEIRLAMDMPLDIAAVRLTGAIDHGAASEGVLLEGEITPRLGVPARSVRASLEQLIHDPGTSSVLQAMGLSGLPTRISLRETEADVRLGARLEWAEIGRIVELITDTTTGTRAGEPPAVRPVPPPAF